MPTVAAIAATTDAGGSSGMALYRTATGRARSGNESYSAGSIACEPITGSRGIKLRFYVIYSFDIPAARLEPCWNLERVRDWQPPHVRRLWDRAEGDESYEYSYLGGEWAKGKHRKYVALLDRSDFEEFVDRFGLYPEDCETGGSLTGFGHLPAIAFETDDTNAILSAAA